MRKKKLFLNHEVTNVSKSKGPPLVFSVHFDFTIYDMFFFPVVLCENGKTKKKKKHVPSKETAYCEGVN